MHRLAFLWKNQSKAMRALPAIIYGTGHIPEKVSKERKKVDRMRQSLTWFVCLGQKANTAAASLDRTPSPPASANKKPSSFRKQHGQQPPAAKVSAKHQEMEQNPISAQPPPPLPIHQMEAPDAPLTTTTHAVSVYNHPFDADTRVMPGNMIISPTCSTSSHHSSSTIVSATVSISSISTSDQLDSNDSPLEDSPNSTTTAGKDENSNGSTLLTNANKSASSFSASSTASCSSAHSFSSAQSHPTSQAPVVLSSPTPTATKTNTSTNPSIALRNKAANSSRLTLKSPKRNLTESKNTKTINRTTTMTTMTKSKAGDMPIRTKKKKKLHVRFISTAKVQDTFSKQDYDRASDPYAVWTHLTAQLAQQIKDELNAFKLEEMLVHHLSRGNTQFFL